MKLGVGATIGLVVGALGVILGIYASIAPMQVASWFTGSGAVNWLPTAIPVIVIGIMVISFAPFIKNMMGNSAKKKRLQQVGQKTGAKILDVQDTGMTVNMNPYVKVTVEMPGGKSATFQVLVSRVQIPRIGDVIQVLYDPADPTIVMPA